MNRNQLFDDYIRTRFSDNTDLSDARIRLENDIFDRNLRKFLSEDRKVRILEIGFGTGFFLKYLLSNGYENVHGIDLSKDITEFVKKNVYDGVECVPSTEVFLDKHKGEYDYIFMFDVLEHVPKDETVGLLIKIREALKVGGVFIARVPSSGNPFNTTGLTSDFTHEVYYSARSLVQVNRLAKFSDVATFPFKEENLTWHGKITNVTQKIMIRFIKLMIGLNRCDLDPMSIYTKNMFCVCKR